MIRLAVGLTERIASASAAADLHDLVQAAIQLEFATIPPYLTAMLSLHPDKNREVWSIIHSVVVDEMLHMSLACNLLNAIGGRPFIASADFVPTYPTALPLGIGDLTVGLAAYSPAVVKSVFMQIEEPEAPLVFAALVQYETIGMFYEALKHKLMELGSAAFMGDPARQVSDTSWFSSSRLFALRTPEDATRAIDLIVRDGEGTSVSPLAPEGTLAHYYRFQQLVEGRRLVADASAPNGFRFAGAPIAYDSAGVWPVRANQSLTGLDPDSLGGRRARQFAYVFSKLMRALQRTFDGEPDQLDAAMGLMFELKLAGQGLVSVADGVDDDGSLVHLGPVFSYVSFNE